MDKDIDWLDVSQAFQYNESTGEFHDVRGKVEEGKDGWKTLCFTTERMFYPFYNLIQRMYDFSRIGNVQKENKRPRPDFKALRSLWEQYLTLCKDIVYYKELVSED